jgi:RecA-superfamily ATPases implicated in signal transduction
MTSKTASLLTDPQPHSHIVYPSTDEALIAEAVGVFASAGLKKGEAVVLVTTDARRGVIECHLKADGFDVRSFQNSGQLAFLEASELLSVFLKEGMPDAEMFKTSVTRVIERACTNPETGEARKVRIFGEMVSLLYMGSNTAAAERLEEFWNEMVEAYSVSLFCAYSLVPKNGWPRVSTKSHRLPLTPYQ